MEGLATRALRFAVITSSVNDLLPALFAVWLQCGNPPDSFKMEILVRSYVVVGLDVALASAGPGSCGARQHYKVTGRSLLSFSGEQNHRR